MPFKLSCLLSAFLSLFDGGSFKVEFNKCINAVPTDPVPTDPVPPNQATCPCRSFNDIDAIFVRREVILNEETSCKEDGDGSISLNPSSFTPGFPPSFSVSSLGCIEEGDQLFPTDFAQLDVCRSLIVDKCKRLHLLPSRVTSDL
jgi:hypothetical protein